MPLPRAAKITVEVLPFRLIRPEPERYELIAHIGQIAWLRKL